MSKSTSRRAVLAGAAAAIPAVAVPAVALPGAPDPIFAADADLETLWRHRRELLAEADRLGVAYNKATASMPTWAQSGPVYLCSDGTYREGRVAGWPEIPNPVPPDNPGIFVNVRPGPHDIKRHYEQSLHLVPPNARAQHRAAYRERVRAFIARRREQAAEEARVGLPALEYALNVNCHATNGIDTAIACMPYSPNVLAARIMIELGHDVDGSELLQEFLVLLRPHLSGVIAEDAAAMLREAQS